MHIGINSVLFQHHPYFTDNMWVVFNRRTSANLVRYRKLHSGEKWYKLLLMHCKMFCKYGTTPTSMTTCGWYLIDAHQLVNHSWMHSGQKRYKLLLMHCKLFCKSGFVYVYVHKHTWALIPCSSSTIPASLTTCSRHLIDIHRQPC